MNKKLHHWQAEYGKLFRKYRDHAMANKCHKKELDACQKKLERFKVLEQLFLRCTYLSTLAIGQSMHYIWPAVLEGLPVSKPNVSHGAC